MINILEYKHFTRQKNFEVYHCQKCKKDFIEKIGYISNYLTYICEKCFKEIKEEI